MSASRKLLEWYEREARDLPWRRHPSPYRVWVSEIMLQQTTVATAAPYFTRFIDRFPTMRALAGADEQEVLAAWSGLGYYRRARHLLQAARLMMQRHGGRVPADLASLRALPGIGPYTAGAILSIGHGKPAPALDANVLRVAARMAGIEDGPESAPARRAIEQFVLGMIPPDDASRFNQALMDLGAAVCTPRRPGCEACPMSAGCVARREGTQESIPPSRKALAPMRVAMAALVVRRGGSVMLMERTEGPLMKGMWEFPLVPASTLAEARLEAGRLGARVTGCAGQVSHSITNHRLKITIYEARSVRRTGARAPARTRRRGSAAAAVSEPYQAVGRLATPDGPGRPKWARLDEITGSGAAGLALTGTARKISRLLAAAS